MRILYAILLWAAFGEAGLVFACWYERSWIPFRPFNIYTHIVCAALGPGMWGAALSLWLHDHQGA